MEINAKALTVKPSSENTVYSFTSDGSCQFDLTKLSPTDDTLKLVVSSSGMIVVHEEPNVATSKRQVEIALPEQTLPVAELAGTWNVAAWQPANLGKAGTAVAANAEFTVDATGQITAFKGCLGLFACVPNSAPFGKFVTNPSGGFDVVDANGAVVNRVFLYKTLAGRKVAVGLQADNTLSIAVPMNPLGGIARGRHREQLPQSRDRREPPLDSVSPLTEDTVTITATDSAAKTVTRLADFGQSRRHAHIRQTAQRPALSGGEQLHDQQRAYRPPLRGIRAASPAGNGYHADLERGGPATTQQSVLPVLGEQAVAAEFDVDDERAAARQPFLSSWLRQLPPALSVSFLVSSEDTRCHHDHRGLPQRRPVRSTVGPVGWCRICNAVTGAIRD